ncbi:MAG TPA: polysaccharide deacetylase family protein [Bacteroidia bacterium]|nr:polysaccharide deacetylase family protein [Bacteroidia bacterium]
MKYDPKIHSWRHLVKSALGRMEFLLTGEPCPPGELLVLNYHGTPLKFMDNFREQIRFFRDRFDFISPAQLGDYFSGKPDPKKSYALITFDDGLRNNLHAAEVLREFNIRAYFFIVPAFINAPAGDQKNYYLQHIRPQINPAIDSREEDLLPLSWEDVRRLHSEGHGIGAHSLTHDLLASGSEEESRKEIISCREVIYEKTGVMPDSFCSPNNSLLSAGKKEMQLIRENYRYHFSTLPGSNTGASPFFIRRVNVESFWLKGAVMRATGKWDRKRWTSRIMQFSAVVNGN